MDSHGLVERLTGLRDYAAIHAERGYTLTGNDRDTLTEAIEHIERLERRQHEAEAWAWLHLRGESGLPYIAAYEALRSMAGDQRRPLLAAAQSVQAEDDGYVVAALPRIPPS